MLPHLKNGPDNAFAILFGINTETVIFASLFGELAQLARASRIKLREGHRFDSDLLVLIKFSGGLAQLARAFAWHAKGHRFDSGNLHNQVRSLADFFIAMTYCAYIIYSPFLDQFYIGYSQDIDDRIFRHNNSGSKATKKSNDWKLVYTKYLVLKRKQCDGN